MWPEIRTETVKLNVAMTELTKENNNLRNENFALKGSNDDKMKHLENENSRLQQLYDQTLSDINSAKRQNDEYRRKMASLNEALNIKTQENILKQEAIDEKVKTFLEFSETCNNQNNQLNQL